MYSRIQTLAAVTSEPSGRVSGGGAGGLRSQGKRPTFKSVCDGWKFVQNNECIRVQQLLI